MTVRNAKKAGHLIKELDLDLSDIRNHFPDIEEKLVSDSMNFFFG